MKYTTIIAILLGCISVYSQASLRSLKKKQEKSLSFILEDRKTKPAPIKRKQRGNLPLYMLRSNPRSVKASNANSILPKNSPRIYMNGIRRGDILNAVITQNLKAYRGSSAPIKAVISNGHYKNSILTGVLTLNTSTKNITAEFDTFRDATSDLEYTFSGSALDVSGEEGVKGQYVNNRAKGFWAAMLSGFITGYSKSTIEYTKSEHGYEKVPSANNHLKEGVASAATKTSKNYERDVYNEPEYTLAIAPVRVSIFIKKQPYIK
jgi:hypothetical protein